MDLVLIIAFAFGGAYLGYIVIAALEARRQRKLRALKSRQEFNQMINDIRTGPLRKTNTSRIYPHTETRDVTPTRNSDGTLETVAAVIAVDSFLHSGNNANPYEDSSNDSSWEGGGGSFSGGGASGSWDSDSTSSSDSSSSDSSSYDSGSSDSGSSDSGGSFGD